MLRGVPNELGDDDQRDEEEDEVYSRTLNSNKL